MPSAASRLGSLLACVALAAGAATPQSLRLGMLAPEGSFDALRSWDFMEPYLALALPDVAVEVRRLPHGALRAAIHDGEIDFFIANSGFFVEAEAAHGASPVATLDSPYALSPTQAIASTLIASAGNHEIRGLADLRGKRLVAVHDIAFGGYQLGMHALKQAGVEREDLASLEFTGLPVDQLLEAVRTGRADAAILRSCLFESLTHRGAFNRAQFKVLGPVGKDRYACGRSTDLYPDWPFAMLPHADPALAKRVSMALFAMPRTESGFAWTVPTDYSGIHRVFRDLEIGPYAYLGRQTLGGLVLRYWHWFAFAFVLLAGALLHVVRVESLVRARTRELRGALAERDRIEAESRAKETQLDHLSRLGVLGEMSTMIAHELNQPLSAISNYARGIVRRVEAGRAEPMALVEAGDEIVRQAERAAGIMQRIRDFARKRTGERVEVDLREIVDGTRALFQGMVPGAPAVERVLNPNCKGGALVWVDRLQVEQVLLNLMKNAYDAMRSVPAPQRRIRISCRREDGHFRVEVSDNGEGLENGAATRLFEPFHTTKAEGLGLGLAICKRVIEAHGGQIAARPNAPAPGLTVSFTLPRHPEKPHD